MEDKAEKCPIPGCTHVLSDYSSMQDHLSTFHFDLNSTEYSRCDMILSSLERATKCKKMTVRPVSEQRIHEICIPKVMTTQLTTLIERNPGELNEPTWMNKNLASTSALELPPMTEEKQHGPLPKFTFRSN